MTGHFSFEIDSTDYETPLGSEIWINNQQILDVNHVKEKMSVDIPFDNTINDPVEHELKIILKNKTRKDTKLDSQGNIIKDACLNFTNFVFDNINIDTAVLEHAVYVHNFNDSEDYINDQFFWRMGCNGVVTLKFSTPIYLWFLKKI